MECAKRLGMQSQAFVRWHFLPILYYGTTRRPPSRYPPMSPLRPALALLLATALLVPAAPAAQAAPAHARNAVSSASAERSRPRAGEPAPRGRGRADRAPQGRGHRRQAHAGLSRSRHVRRRRRCHHRGHAEVGSSRGRVRHGVRSQAREHRRGRLRRTQLHPPAGRIHASRIRRAQRPGVSGHGYVGLSELSRGLDREVSEGEVLVGSAT